MDEGMDDAKCVMLSSLPLLASKCKKSSASACESQDLHQSHQDTGGAGAAIRTGSTQT